VTYAAGRYELLGKLGSGGWATVYLARQVELDRLVALKELRALRMPDAEVAERFLREARLAGSLSHPNIVTVYEYFEDQGTPFIAMEYLERGSLRPYVGRMSLPQVAGVLEAVLAGLAHAEERHVIHRDLKPENLLVTSEGSVKIADFGIAKATNALQAQAPALTSTGVAVGTPNYMAPEQALAHEAGPLSDLYSVGIMAFEFFVGLPPFGDTDQPMGVLLRQVNENVPAVNDLDPRVDARLSDWIGRMLAKDPAERPQSARAAWDEAEEIFIALLGSRWRRAAALDVQRRPPPEPLQPGAGVFVGGFTPSEAATAPVEPAWAAATSMPRRALPDAAAAPVAPAKRRRGRAATKILIATVAVVAAAAALLSRPGQDPSPGGGAQTPAGGAGVVTVATPPAGAGGVNNTSGGTGGKIAPSGGSKAAGPSHAAAPPPSTPTTQPTHAAQPPQNEEEEPPPSPCGGDSASDDPSDDSCSP
jgi:tRNA A-37 threonylcarbamoyl transferase component Bud32